MQNLFSRSSFLKSFQQFNTMYKMNEIVSKFLLAGDKFVPEIYLGQPGLTCSACGPFTKNKERIQKLKKKTRDSKYIYHNELDKACFQHDMTYVDFKHLTKRTASIVYNFFDKNPLCLHVDRP